MEETEKVESVPEVAEEIAPMEQTEVMEETPAESVEETA